MRPLILRFPSMTSLLAGYASQHQNAQVVVSSNGATPASASADKARTPSPAPNGYAYTYVENHDPASGEDFPVTRRPRERN